MFIQILKKDLKRKKGMNLILFLLLILSSIFLAGGINNLLLTMNAIDYFFEKANVSDFYAMTMGAEENENRIEEWLKEEGLVEAVDEDSYLLIEKEDNSFGSPMYLCKIRQKQNLIFDTKNQPVFLEQGEIAISVSQAEQNGIKPGDKIRFQVGDKEISLQVKVIVKDVLFGSPFVGFNAQYVSDRDFAMVENALLEEESIITGYGISTLDVLEFEQKFSNEGFPVNTTMTQKELRKCYIMDMLFAAFLMIISICLLAVSFVIFKFTITFTLQEEIKESGVMKAIGISSFAIRGIYLCKYFAVSVAGALLGAVFSIPFSNFMMKSIEKNMYMPRAQGNLLLCLSCGCIIVFLVMGFCYICTGKIRRLTVMEAVKSGSNGERYGKSSPLSLYKSGKLPTLFFLAANDILSSKRKYIPLFISFILGVIMIILPLNAVNTLKGDSIITMFGIARSDVYMVNNKEEAYIKDGDMSKMLADLRHMEETYAKEGIYVKLYNEINYFPYVSSETNKDKRSILSLQAKNFHTENYRYLEGEPPKLSNELAMTTMLAEELNVTIGDTVYLQFAKEKIPYILTATFESFNNLGYSIRLSETAETDLKYAAGFYGIQGHFREGTDVEAAISKMKKITPDYEIKNTREKIAAQLGTVIERVGEIKLLTVSVVIMINSLVTILLCRTFLERDKGEIALLKSIGFSNGFLRAWQSMRIGMIQLVSVFFGILCSYLLNDLMIQYTFGIMGARQVELSIEPMEVYVGYPLLLLAGVLASAYFAASGVKKFSVRKINDME